MKGTVSVGISGSLEEVIGRASMGAGFKVRWSSCTTLRDLVARRTRVEIASGTSLRSEWNDMYYHGPGRDGWAYILEDDHILVLPREKALAFWKQWWADEQAKSKK